MPVRICLMCRYHLDSTDSIIICGCDDKIKELKIFKGTVPIRDCIISCPLLVSENKIKKQYRSCYKKKAFDYLLFKRIFL